MKISKKQKILLLSVLIFFAIILLIYLNKDKIISIIANNQNKEASYEPTLVSQPTLANILNDDYFNIDGIINYRNKTTLNITLYVESTYCIRTVECNSQTFSNEENENWLQINFDINEVDFYSQLPISITMASDEVFQYALQLQYLKLPNTAPSVPNIVASPPNELITSTTNLTLTANNSSDEENDSFTYVWEGRTAETSTYAANPNSSYTTYNVKVKAVDQWGYSSDWTTYTFYVSDTPITPKIGDFVNYSAGDWTPDDMKLLGVSFNEDETAITSYGSYYGGPWANAGNLRFGRFTCFDDQVVEGSITKSKDESYFSKTSNKGWQILSLNSDGTINEIVHAGTPELHTGFYPGSQGGNIALNSFNRNWNMYATSKFAQSAYYVPSYITSFDRYHSVRCIGVSYYYPYGQHSGYLYIVSASGEAGYYNYASGPVGVRPAVKLKAGVRIDGDPSAVHNSYDKAWKLTFE